MIRFQCNNCGQKFSVPESQAGKKGTCPKCKGMVVVPKSQKTYSLPEQSESENPHIDSGYSAYDLTLLDIPKVDEVLNRPDIASGKIKESTTATYTEPVSERRFPWLIDIFLYPTSKAGLMILVIIIVIRWFFKIVARGLGSSTQPLSPLVVIVVPLLCIFIIIRAILYLYYWWYLCECVRDSAEGGVRAPETLGRTPGLGGMLWLFLRTCVCLVVIAAPVLGYYLSTRRIDTVFWSFLAFAVLFMPMGILAFVMFDSFSGLNPFLLIGSIFRVFLPYCAMLAVFVLLGFLVALNVPDKDFSLLQTFIIYCVVMYLLMVTAHLLGWFYNRYKRRLNWDV